MTLLTRIVFVALCVSGVAACGQQTPSANNSAPADTQAQHPAVNASQQPPTGNQQQPQTDQSQTNQQPPQANQSQSNQQPPLTSEQVLKQEEKQRALGIVPMFGMTSVQNAPPLSSQQKFQLMWKTMYDPFTFVSAGITAGLGQASDSFPQYGQGAAGFGRRYGSALADNADSNFFSNFVYPVIFKQDPRYFRVGQGPIKKRLWIAVEEEFVARKDSGGQTFHFSNVLGAITAGTISNVYYPSQSRGVGLTAGRAATALGYGCLGNVFLEFWPDIDQKFFHKPQDRDKPSNPPGNSRAGS